MANFVACFVDAFNEALIACFVACLVATLAAFMLNFGALMEPVEVGTPTLLARMAFFTTVWLVISDFFWNDIFLSPCNLRIHYCRSVTKGHPGVTPITKHCD